MINGISHNVACGGYITRSDSNSSNSSNSSIIVVVHFILLSRILHPPPSSNVFILREVCVRAKLMDLCEDLPPSFSPSRLLVSSILYSG